MFLDETGFRMAPRVRRTGAPRSQTPVFYPRGGSDPKVSGMGALAIPPARDRLPFYFRLHPHRNIHADRALGFRSQWLRPLRGNLLVIGDGSGPPLARQVETFLDRPLRLCLEYLPPYAPALNPVE